MRGDCTFWPNHTVKQPTKWTKWIDHFCLSNIVKENLDINNFKKPLA